jgi:superfamily II DNA or RNA helicase
MSRVINISNFTDEQIKKLNTELKIEKEVSKYSFGTQPEIISLFHLEKNNTLFVPFSYDNTFVRPERKQFPQCNVEFVGKLREPQKEVMKESIDFLNKKGSIIIACYPGFGKTTLSTFISCKIKLKTIILCNRIILIKQWNESIQKNCPNSKIQILSSKSKLSVEADFYIINASNVCKHTREFYKDIGLVIVDEAHLIMAKTMSKSMLYLQPRYVIGLSATPYRTDGLNILLDMYFGTEKITRELYRKHHVYKVDTLFKPETKLNSMGKIDWSALIESQCENQDRNNIIIKIINFFPDRIFLVLCKRVSQATYIYEKLKENGEDVTSLIGKNQTYEQSSRILVGTVQKAGVGFDHPNLNALILASDVEQYFIQYLGRVFRREDTEPIIFDLVDKNPILFKHFLTRNEIYKKHGGIVKNFLNEFQNFE